MKNYPFENKFLKISDFVAFGLKMSLAFSALFKCLMLLTNSKQF